MILWLDTETTGVDPRYNEIITISGLITDNLEGDIIDSFNFKVRPNFPDRLSEKATEIHGYTQADVKEFTPAAEVVNKISTILKTNNERVRIKYNKNKREKYFLAGYNTNFDKDMLINFYDLHSKDSFWQFFNGYYYDVFHRVQERFIRGSIGSNDLKLPTLAKSFGIYHDAHNSMSDIEVTRSLHFKL